MQAPFQDSSRRLVSGATDRSPFGGMATRLRFTLERWSLWYPGAPVQERPWPNGRPLPEVNGAPDLEFLPMMQRRRLSPLARAAIAVAWDCRGSHAELPAVFFSRHGESRHYFDMLCELAQHREISPSRFSLSVHNAIAGLYSLCSDTRSPCLALAGGKDDFYGAFLEAAGLLMETSCRQVLVICYEQPLPEAYRSYVAGPDRTLALGLRLSAAGGEGPQLELGRASATPAAGCLLQAFCEAILRGERHSPAADGRSLWAWKLSDG